MIWLALSDWIFQKSGTRIVFDVKTVIFGNLEEDHMAINLVILLVKKYLFQQSKKNNNIVFNEILKYLNNYYCLEEKLSGNIFYKNRWSKWKCLFNVSKNNS